TLRAVRIRTTQMLPAIAYNHCHEIPRFNNWDSTAGPTIDPTPKNPSTVFIIDVCSAVDREMSPMRASAPVLKMPIAMPESAISTEKNTNEVPAMNKYDAAANSVRPTIIVALRPY